MAEVNNSNKRKKGLVDTPKTSSKSGKQMTLELRAMTDELDPLLMVSFPGSVVNEDLKLNYEKSSGSSWKSQLSAETRELTYSGSNFGRNSHSLNTSQWLIGVADVESDTISLHPVSHTFALRATLKGTKETVENDSNETSARERRALLFEDFGASKKKRALAASAANLVSSEQAIGADAISSWMGQESQTSNNTVEGGDETDAALVEGRKVLLPPFDLKATLVKDCFDIRGLVGEAERGSLGRQLASLRSVGSGWLETDPIVEWFPYVTRRLSNEEIDKEELIDLLLLRHLMAMFTKHSKLFRGPLKDDAKALDIPTDVMKCLLDKFSIASDPKGDGSLSWRVTKNLQDKLLLHLLVLALKVSGFKIDTTELASDLRLSPSEVANFLRLAACRISVDKNTGGHTAVLTAPLVFPGRRRKRG